MAVLDENKKRIQYYAFHWDYFKQTIMKPSEMISAIDGVLAKKIMAGGKLKI